VHRVSGIDAALLERESPGAHLHMAAVVVLEPMPHGEPVPFDVVRSHVAERLVHLPDLRRRLVSVPFGLDRPLLVDDPDFRLSAHVHRVGVPAPGGDEQVGNLVGELVGLPLNRGKPLWELWYLEGLEGGRVALVVKAHQVVIDGNSGADLVGALMGPAPVATEPGNEDGSSAPPLPDAYQLAARGVGAAAMAPLRAVEVGIRALQQAARALPRTVGSDPSARYAPNAPATSFNGPLTPHRRVAFSSVPWDDVRRVRQATGVKVHDVVLALCAGSLRAELTARGEHPTSALLAQAPVSFGAGDTAGRGSAVRVGAMTASLATDVHDPLARLLAIHASTSASVELRDALAVERIRAVSDAAPPALANLAARATTLAGLDTGAPRSHNVVVTNVPGPADDLSCSGARVAALYPLVPLPEGVGVAFSFVSRGDRLDVGVVTCRDLAPDAWRLVRGVSDALGDLVGSVAHADGPSRGGRRRSVAGE
jgi:WS/DGAT/MGAT family acyltransferase